MSTLKVNNISPQTSWGTDGHPYTIPGMVLQVQGTTITSRESIGALTTSSATLAVPQLSATITPTSASSKILVNVVATFGYNDGTGHCRLRRTEGGTDSYPFRGDAGGSNNSRMSLSHRPAATSYGLQTWDCSFQFLDSPSSTNELMYGLEIFSGTTYTATWILNGPQSYSNLDYMSTTASAITLMEIAG